MMMELPFLMKDFARTGSSAGSISSRMSCNSTGFPNCRELSMVLIIMSPMFWLSSLQPLGPSMFLIHFLAWPWGSTIKGHLFPLVTSTPFSVENESLGKPWMFQSLTSLGLARKRAKLKFGLDGMFSSFTCLYHVSCTRMSRYSLGKGPAYDKKADASTTSPGMYSSCCSYSVMEDSQRDFSPARPVTSFSALCRALAGH